MKKTRLLVWFLTLTLLWAAWMGSVNAETTITHYPDSNVEYTLNKWFTTESGFTAWTITISDWETTITMLDRNLWASTSDTTSTGSYWYHFQRWNNYGFKPCSNGSWCSTFPNGESTSNTQVDASGYWPWTYYSSGTFIIWSSDWSSVQNDNLRWWSTDDNTYNVNGDTWKVSNPTDRQWPCPEWFHVPSVWELAKIYSMMLSDDDLPIHNPLLVPFAGYRYYNATLYFGGTADLRSSSPSYPSYPNNTSSRYLRLEVDGSMAVMNMSKYYRASAYSVRCFHDSYKTYTQSSSILVSFYDEGGTTQIWSGEVESGTILAESGDITDILSWYENSKTGYSFNGWIISGTDTVFDLSTETTKDFELVASWIMETYSISIELDGWTIQAWETNPTSYNVESEDITLKNPVKEWYTFAWWTWSNWNTAETTVMIAKWSTGDREYFANWTANPKPVSNWWGGGSTLKKDNCPDGDYSDSYYDGTCGKQKISEDEQKTSEDSSQAQNDGERELKTAYERAYENWITTMDTIQKADLNGNLTRIAMAKMLSQYAINVLWMTPDETRINKFNDVNEKLDSEYNSWVSLAYQLWIMWINMPDERFRPFDLVPRSEFVTALSRMKYRTPDGKDLYYSTHMELLNKLWIVKVMDPTMLELRGYVMLMLMRSEK